MLIGMGVFDGVNQWNTETVSRFGLALDTSSAWVYPSCVGLDLGLRLVPKIPIGMQ